MVSLHFAIAALLWKASDFGNEGIGLTTLQAVSTTSGQEVFFECLTLFTSKLHSILSVLYM